MESPLLQLPAPCRRCQRRAKTGGLDTPAGNYFGARQAYPAFPNKAIEGHRTSVDLSSTRRANLKEPFNSTGGDQIIRPNSRSTAKLPRLPESTHESEQEVDVRSRCGAAAGGPCSSFDQRVHERPERGNDGQQGA